MQNALLVISNLTWLDTSPFFCCPLAPLAHKSSQVTNHQ
jgi:hypothetical protein